LQPVLIGSAATKEKMEGQREVSQEGRLCPNSFSNVVSVNNRIFLLDEEEKMMKVEKMEEW